MLVTDIVEPGELLGFVREIPFYDFTLDRFLPNRQRPTIEYAFDRTDRSRAKAAQYRPFDVESPVGSRPGLARVRGSIPPMSKKMVLTEEERLLFEMLRNGGNGPVSPELIEAVFDDAALLTEAVQARVEYARGQVLSTGKVTFLNDFGIPSAEVDYAVPVGNFVAPVTPWSTVASATPVADIRGWIRNVYQPINGGRTPAAAIISSTVLGYLQGSDEIRQLAQGGTLPGVSLPGISPEQVSGVFRAQGLPPFVIYDTSVDLEADGVVRVLPEESVIFVPQPGDRFGETTYGVTAEALELVRQQQIEFSAAPGISGFTMRTFDPVHLWTKVAALVLPVLKDPNSLLVADVSNNS